MKTFIYITIIFLLFTSCATSMHRREKGHASAASKTENALFDRQWHRLDSAGRQWLYASDTAFYFHPNKGVFAERGKILASESQIVSESLSGSMAIGIQEATTSKEAEDYVERRQKRSSWYWLAGLGIPLIMLIIWRGARRFIRST